MPLELAPQGKGRGGGAEYGILGEMSDVTTAEHWKLIDRAVTQGGEPLCVAEVLVGLLADRGREFIIAFARTQNREYIRALKVPRVREALHLIDECASDQTFQTLGAVMDRGSGYWHRFVGNSDVVVELPPAAFSASSTCLVAPLDAWEALGLADEKFPNIEDPRDAVVHGDCPIAVDAWPHLVWQFPRLQRAWGLQPDLPLTLHVDQMQLAFAVMHARDNGHPIAMHLLEKPKC